ncbi:MAG: ABC transporter substrate-binding protein [Candidatus Limnocylindria bacterium]
MSPRARRLPAVPALLVVLVAVLLAACSPGPTTTIPPEATGSIVPATTASPTPDPTPEPSPAFPVSVTDDEGTTTEIATEPQRIVSLSPANTEILFAIGAGDRVVATDNASDFPAEAADLPDVIAFEGFTVVVDVEQIVALEADLVVAAGLGFTPPDAVAQLRDLGIPVVVVYAPTVEAVYADIELIGTAVGASEAATELTASMRAEIDAISSAVAAAGTPPRTFYEIGYDGTTGAIYAPADDSFVAEMVLLAGGDAITTGDPNSYEIPLEVLISADPDVILLGVNAFYMPTAEEVAARPGWGVMTAVAGDAIRPVEDTVITRPGPRLAEGLRNLASAIWPDVTLPAAP